MSRMHPLKVAILISGRGSNMAALARACAAGRIEASIVRVIADRASAVGVALARQLGLDAEVIEARKFAGRSAFEAALMRSLQDCGAELVVLAGFMRILSADFVQQFAGRMLNIHPSLLPRYKGLNTHRRVLEALEREHGSSVHFVTDELDGGPVICQARVPVLAGDSEQTLEARVLALEHRIYPYVVGLIAAGRLELRGHTVVVDGGALRAPLAYQDDDGLKQATA
jgi:phosphoribosylglycinamide formyltransferase 1